MQNEKPGFDFNINRRNFPRLISVFLFIVALSVIRINFGYSLIAVLLIVPFEAYLYKNGGWRSIGSKQPNQPERIEQTKGQILFIISGVCIIIAIFVSIFVWQDQIQSFIIKTFPPLN